jgi:hypothetical protein
MITSQTVSNDLLTLTWSAIAGETYRLEFQEHITGTNWVDVPGAVVAPGNSASQTNALDAATRFFRVRWLP